MLTLDYLYYKYFRQQQRVGDGDIAPIGAIFIIELLLMLNIYSLLMFIDYQWQIVPIWVRGSVPLGVFLVGTFLALGWRYLYKGRWRHVITRYENESLSQRRWGTFYATIWPVLTFGWMFFLFYLFATDTRERPARPSGTGGQVQHFNMNSIPDHNMIIWS